mgnify:CR=1 FL=1
MSKTPSTASTPKTITLVLVAIGMFFAVGFAVMSISLYKQPPPGFEARFVTCTSGPEVVFVGKIKKSPDVDGDRITIHPADVDVRIDIINGSCAVFHPIP